MADTPPDVDLKSDLTDDVALVTGANRGIGAKIATKLADLGATVYAGARDPTDVTENRRESLAL